MTAPAFVLFPFALILDVGLRECEHCMNEWGSKGRMAMFDAARRILTCDPDLLARDALGLAALCAAILAIQFLPVFA